MGIVINFPKLNNLLILQSIGTTKNISPDIENFLQILFKTLLEKRIIKDYDEFFAYLFTNKKTILKTINKLELELDSPSEPEKQSKGQMRKD